MQINQQWSIVCVWGIELEISSFLEGDLFSFVRKYLSQGHPIFLVHQAAGNVLEEVLRVHGLTHQF
jgi:hypothetical protein